MMNSRQRHSPQFTDRRSPSQLNRRQFVSKSLAGAAAAAFSLSTIQPNFAQSTTSARLSEKPSRVKPKRILIDTDAKNEIDDQYAIVQALIAPELKIEAITAAGFLNKKTSAQRGYDEVKKILNLMKLKDEIPTALGSWAPMKDKRTPQPTAATQLIIERAMADEPEPLYVLGLGQFTNLASALLIEPKIKDRVIFACIDGDYQHGQDPAWGIGSYNWTNDVPAVQAIFESDVRYIHMPARSVTEKMYIRREVVAKQLADLGPVYDFLIELWNEGRFKKLPGKILWDMALVHVMIDPTHGKKVTVGAPTVNDDGTTKDNPSNARKMDVYAEIDADEIFESFWKSIREHANETKKK